MSDLTVYLLALASSLNAVSVGILAYKLKVRGSL